MRLLLPKHVEQQIMDMRRIERKNKIYDNEHEFRRALICGAAVLAVALIIYLS